jgi:hypothetical protein
MANNYIHNIPDSSRIESLITKEDNMKTTLEQELLTLKKMLVEGHDEMRNSKKKNVSSFGVSYYLLQVIVQTNACLNRLDEVNKKEQLDNMANDTVHQQLFGI